MVKFLAGLAYQTAEGVLTTIRWPAGEARGIAVPVPCSAGTRIVMGTPSCGRGEGYGAGIFAAVVVSGCALAGPQEQAVLLGL